MQRKPRLLSMQAEKPQQVPVTREQVAAASEIILPFTERIALNGLICLFAYSEAYTKKLSFDMDKLKEAMGFLKDDGYPSGVLATTRAIGLIDFTWKDAVNIISMPENLVNALRPALEKRLKEAETDSKRYQDTGVTKEQYIQYIQRHIASIEAYFQDL
jgi:hypothetical protein